MSATALTFLITLSSAAPANSRRNFLATHAGLRDVFYRTDSVHVHRPGLEAQRLGIIRQDSGSASVSLNEERDQHGKPRFRPTLLLGATHAERLKIEVLARFLGCTRLRPKNRLPRIARLPQNVKRTSKRAILKWLTLLDARANLGVGPTLLLVATDAERSKWNSIWARSLGSDLLTSQRPSRRMARLLQRVESITLFATSIREVRSPS